MRFDARPAFAMARTTAEELRAYGWRIFTVTVNLAMLLFLACGVMIQGEQGGTQQLMWSMSIVVWVGSLTITNIANNLDSPDAGETVQIVEGSHLWQRLKYWLESSRIATGLSKVEVRRVGVSFEYNIWSDDWTMTFVLKRGDEFSQGWFLRAGEGAQTWIAHLCDRVLALIGCKSDLERFTFEYKMTGAWEKTSDGQWRRAACINLSAKSSSRLRALLIFVHNSEQGCSTRPRTDTGSLQAALLEEGVDHV